MIVEGSIDIFKGGELVKTLKRHELVGQELLLETEVFDYDAVTKEQCRLMVFRKEELADLMSQHVELMEVYIKILNGDFEKEANKEDEFDLSLFN